MGRAKTSSDLRSYLALAHGRGLSVRMQRSRFFARLASRKATLATAHVSIAFFDRLRKRALAGGHRRGDSIPPSGCTRSADAPFAPR